ncbi:uncharacterized protein SCHCODRAFT_02527869 [Schizophyllum commune H4-8]|uniref:Fungal-type protein kinase domain-containing protein n=1 Tax=Schizophyllum commune (strain H4-8 / FGSC 9210) TaxID=578458 RepID=D8PKT5_SCHCM|nr:uncharacterized protein SCHCODRAFT_02527869 [Schizophyllum commune H4-8]KAI5897567.1 hypothetical protein SCHCODRAFT_02527869 [Schizophyllum commune H4-8]
MIEHTSAFSFSDFYERTVGEEGWQRVSDGDMEHLMDALFAERLFDRRSRQWKALRKKPFIEYAADGMADISRRLASVAPTVCKAHFATGKPTAEIIKLRSAHRIFGQDDTPLACAAIVNYLSDPTYQREARAGSAYNHTLSRDQSGGSDLIYSADVAVLWHLESFQDRESIEENEMKSANAARYMLYNDVRRTHVFAVTMEGTSARLWCHSRSGSVVTSRFDIHKDARELVQFLLFSTFATPSQLGFDPTVRRVVDSSGKLHYQFDVLCCDGAMHTFQSVKIEHDRLEAPLHSRATSVFKVFDIGAETDSYKALRDYWPSEDDFASQESVIQQEVLDALKARLPKEEYEKLRPHFMTILADGPVHRRSGSRGGESERETGLDDSAEPERKRCRTVYEEHCQALWYVDDPAVFFFALAQVMYVLNNLRRAGYVYRDVSSGNILVQTLASATDSAALSDCYITKVSDLEYAKAYDQLTLEEPRLGTCLFMAVEVQAQAHLFCDPDDMDLVANGYFHHNFLHDVESVIWMALYFITGRCSREVYETLEWYELREHIKEVKTYEKQILPFDSNGSHVREEVVTGLRQRRKLLSHLKRLYGDDTPLTKIVDALDCLRDTYRAVENDRTINCEHRTACTKTDPLTPRLPESVFEKNAQIYETLREIFEDISQYFVDTKHSLVKFSDLDYLTGKFLVQDRYSSSTVLKGGKDAAAPNVEANSGMDGASAKAIKKRKRTDAKEEGTSAKRIHADPSTLITAGCASASTRSSRVTAVRGSRSR